MKRGPQGTKAGNAAAERLTLDDFHSADLPMLRCLERARVAARTEIPILILGETGTGKTLLARAIHNLSKRAGGPFVSFNAAALSETLLDSQLFGHEAGAFTGAQRAIRGKFELADGGTLFIDEIADMAPAAQAKILRAVEYGEFERLGSERLECAEVRLISATRLPLQKLVAADHFRKDLFYRLSGISLAIPPLRDRPNDLRALITAEIVAASRQQDKRILGLEREAAELLFAYPWPGNLRELKSVIHTAVAVTVGEVILPDAILLEKLKAPAVVPTDRSRDNLEPGSDLTLSAVEQRHIHRVLEATGGNKRKAARVLGVSRSTLDRKLTPQSPCLSSTLS